MTFSLAKWLHSGHLAVPQTFLLSVLLDWKHQEGKREGRSPAGAHQPRLPPSQTAPSLLTAHWTVQRHLTCTHWKAVPLSPWPPSPVSPVTGMQTGTKPVLYHRQYSPSVYTSGTIFLILRTIYPRPSCVLSPPCSPLLLLGRKPQGTCTIPHVGLCFGETALK